MLRLSLDGDDEDTSTKTTDTDDHDEEAVHDGDHQTARAEGYHFPNTIKAVNTGFSHGELWLFDITLACARKPLEFNDLLLQEADKKASHDLELAHIPAPRNNKQRREKQ